MGRSFWPSTHQYTTTSTFPHQSNNLSSNPAFLEYFLALGFLFGFAAWSKYDLLLVSFVSIALARNVQFLSVEFLHEACPTPYPPQDVAPRYLGSDRKD